MNADSSSPRLHWCWGLLVFFAVLLLSLPQAALLPLLDRDEPRFAEASREMLQSGDYFVPTFNHEPRYNKPPMVYWAQALAFALFGENAFAARFPSLVATAATALLLFSWGGEWAGVAGGVAAALGYAFCLQTAQQGRVATADALLIFWMTLGVGAGARMLALLKNPAPAEKVRRHWIGWGLVLTLGLAGGFLAKGPEALLPLLPLFICTRKYGGKIWLSWTAIAALSLLLVSAWAIPALTRSHGDYGRIGLGEGIVDRAVSGLQGHGASSFGWYLMGVPLYLLTFWLSALPWAALLVLYRRSLFRGWKPDELEVYLLLNVAFIFVIFSLMVTKLPHYTLPAFPLIALLLVRRWARAGIPFAPFIQLGWISGVILAVVALAAVPALLVVGATPSPVGTLVRDAHPDLFPETEFALVDFQEPNAVWEMRRIVQDFAHLITKDQAATFLGQSGPRALILSTRLWRQLNIRVDPAWKIYEARGWNAARLSPVDLTLVVHP